MGNRWITFFFIVLQHMSCGLWFFVCLVYIGLCHIKLVSYWLLGRASLVDIGIQIYGSLCRIVCFGAYGRSGMLDTLKIVNGLFLTLSLSFSILSLIGVQICLFILVFLALILLIVVIWVLDICHYSTLPVYVVGFSNKISYVTYIYKKKVIHLVT